MQCLCNTNQTDILHIYLRAYHLEILDHCRLDFILEFEYVTDVNS